MDFVVENHGTIFLLRPITDAAKDWIDQHLPEDSQRFGDAVVVECGFRAKPIRIPV
jgi:hypothetical protein